MVFKPISRLASQSFGKTFTHGYAQSVVAATQSSYASTNTPFGHFTHHSSNRPGRPGTAHAHHSFQHGSGASGLANKTNQTTQESLDADGGLNAYYAAAFQQQQQQQTQGGEGKEWRQYQFQKRIGWKAPSVIPEGRGKGQHDVEAPPSRNPPDHGTLARSYSASAVDDIKAANLAESDAIAEVDEHIALEISAFREPSPAKEERPTGVSSASKQEPGESTAHDLARSRTPSSHSPASVLDEVLSPSTSVSGVTAATSLHDVKSQEFTQHITTLHNSQAYAQIPAVFESMLSCGITPTPTAYTALLDAAIHLPTAKHQIVPKALDVYTDMLRRKISPTTDFYSRLIEVLSRRALDVHHSKSVLQEKQLRYSGLKGDKKFLFASNEAEYAIVAEDDALVNAINVFQSAASKKGRTFSAETYRLLVTACALHGSVDEMIQVFNHMESNKVKPIASMFAPMIEALAKTGDLSSAVEVYNGYKTLAIADDAGEQSIIDRNDNDIYAALVKAYASLGRYEGSNRFVGKIVDSYANVVGNRKERLEAVQDSVVLNGLIEERIAARDFPAALRIAEERNLSPTARSHAMARVCVAAADNGDAGLASKAYEYLSFTPVDATLALLALHIRLGDTDTASVYWNNLVANSILDISFVEPTTLYVAALVQSGRVDEGLMQFREAFSRIRASARSPVARNELSEQVDEAVELVTTLLANGSIRPTPNASMSLLWTMVENGGIMSPSAEHILAGLGPHDIANLSWQNIFLALQVEAGLLSTAEAKLDIAHSARFAHLLDITLEAGMPLDERSVSKIERAVGKLSIERPDIFHKWQIRSQAHSKVPALSQPAYSPLLSPATSSQSPYAENFDPYAATTDYKGSTIICEELESRRNAAGLNEALARFKNIRRAGRHPRYLAYAKLITAAAKEGRTNLTHDILGMARSDMALRPEHAVVRHGWTLILDAMVGACLTAGRRPLAEQFHQELLDIGAAPTANTYGLYITTLKESTKTFDEATEAVTIFSRALSEGVAPSSFLYNALIGKLGKARRIDDCLRYFQEMRNAGIRPTSVTYGTIVNALCRVSDERFAEELFDEMESMPNYKPRPAPYNCLMQFFLNTKFDGKKVLELYERMQSRNIQPTMHTYKLLIDTYATLEPVDLVAAEGILDTIRSSGQRPEAVHYASLIHAKGCVLHDMEGARKTFDHALSAGEFRPQACLYQALFESMVANHCVAETEPILKSMTANRVEMTPYIANTLIHGWATEKEISKSKAIYESVGADKREPSTYESMTRAFLTIEDRDSALATVHEMLSRGYPAAVSNKILELVGHGTIRAGNLMTSNVIA